MKRFSLIALTWLICAGTALAQGVQTGAIRGLVQDQQDRTVPGASVTVTSPALLGPRSTVTDGLGNYSLTALPPGSYEITFELSGFTTIEVMASVPLGLTVQQDATMKAAGVTETVQVVADAPVPITTPVVGMNFKQPEIELLATPRSLQGIAQLAPAVTENSPNANQVVINGAFAFDSAFLVNGIDVNDNVLAQPQSLFIEDAIEETQILTSGISAEYGRFSGGVINAITKSGGNAVLGQRAHQLPESVVDDRDPVRNVEAGSRCPHRRSAAGLRRDARRPARQGSPVVLCRGPLRGARDAENAVADRGPGRTERQEPAR